MRLLLICFVWLGLIEDTFAQSKPNIVLIISDDQGYTDYGFMGHPQIQTPHLDQFAKQSLVFRKGYVPSSLCCPSLAAIITGLYPHQNKVTNNDPPKAKGSKNPRGSSEELIAKWNGMLDSVPTLPRILAKEGYLSFQTGKWWHGDFTRGGFTHGMTKGTRHGDAGLTIGRQGNQPVFDFIAEAKEKQKPFFLWYAPMMPHTPHTPPERLLEKYRKKTDSVFLAKYWAMCEWFDESCGELLNHLDREKLTQNTLVIYITDNGWIQSTDKNGFAPKNKTSPYDYGHRTPILLRFPGKIQPGERSDFASSIDLAPTILKLIGLDIPAQMQGINLVDETATKQRKTIFGECFTHDSQSLESPRKNLLWRWSMQGDWRLIVPRTYQADDELKRIPDDPRITADLRKTLDTAKPMLFNLANDPKEETDLAEKHPEIVSKMLKELDSWWKP